MPERYKTARLSLLLCAALLISTACSDTSQPLADDVGSAPSSVSAVATSSEPIPSDDEPAVTTTAPIEVTTSSAPTTSPMESIAAPDAPIEDIPDDEPPAEETTASPATTEAAPSTETTAEATTATTTPATEAVRPAAPIVIPEVYVVSASGESVESCDRAMIDYSNASKGYIGVSYSGGSSKAKLRIVGNGETYDHDLAAGGAVQYYPLSQGSGDYSIQIYEHLDGKNYGLVLELKTSVVISNDVDMYLYPNKYVQFVKSSDCVYKAAEVCAGVDGTVERLAAIFDYVTDNITYDHELAATVKSGYIPDPDSALAKGKGICFDYASLVAAMARSQGIPTRLVIGYAADNIYHAWNEVYTEETGWISAELLLSKKGFNIVDATFYSGAADKDAIAKYISDSGNYAAIFRY